MLLGRRRSFVKSMALLALLQTGMYYPANFGCARLCFNLANLVGGKKISGKPETLTSSTLVVRHDFNRRRSKFPPLFLTYLQPHTLTRHSVTLNHPRIVGLQDGPYNNFPGHLLTTDGPEWAILLDYARGHTLAHCKGEYVKQSRPVPEMLIWKYFYQMAEALAFMHWGYGTREFNPKNPYGRKYSFVHRDLKPDNVLRTRYASSRLKMIGSRSISIICWKVCT